MPHNVSDTPALELLRKIRQDPAFHGIEKTGIAIQQLLRHWRDQASELIRSAVPAAHHREVLEALEFVATRARLPPDELRRIIQEDLTFDPSAGKIRRRSPRKVISHIANRAASKASGQPVRTAQRLLTGLPHPPDRLLAKAPTVVMGDNASVRVVMARTLACAARIFPGRPLRLVRLLVERTTLRSYHFGNAVIVEVPAPEWNSLLVNIVEFNRRLRSWYVLLGGSADIVAINDIAYRPCATDLHGNERNVRIGGAASRPLAAVNNWPRGFGTQKPFMLWGLPEPQLEPDGLQRLSELVRLYRVAMTGDAVQVSLHSEPEAFFSLEDQDATTTQLAGLLA